MDLSRWGDELLTPTWDAASASASLHTWLKAERTCLAGSGSWPPEHPAPTANSRFLRSGDPTPLWPATRQIWTPKTHRSLARRSPGENQINRVSAECGWNLNKQLLLFTLPCSGQSGQWSGRQGCEETACLGWPWAEPPWPPRAPRTCTGRRRS